MYLKRFFRLFWQLFSYIVAPLAPPSKYLGGGHGVAWRPAPLEFAPAATNAPGGMEGGREAGRGGGHYCPLSPKKIIVPKFFNTSYMQMYPIPPVSDVGICLLLTTTSH